MKKTLGNSDVNGARKNVPDLQVFGDGDTFKLIAKASSEAEGWMKSTKAMEIVGLGVVVQVTTQQRNVDYSYSVAEALTFVPGACIVEAKDERGAVTGRHIMHNFSGVLCAVKAALEAAEAADAR